MRGRKRIRAGGGRGGGRRVEGEASGSNFSIIAPHGGALWIAHPLLLPTVPWRLSLSITSSSSSSSTSTSSSSSFFHYLPPSYNALATLFTTATPTWFLIALCGKKKKEKNSESLRNSDFALEGLKFAWLQINHCSLPSTHLPAGEIGGRGGGPPNSYLSFTIFRFFPVKQASTAGDCVFLSQRSCNLGQPSKLVKVNKRTEENIIAIT